MVYQPALGMGIEATRLIPNFDALLAFTSKFKRLPANVARLWVGLFVFSNEFMQESGTDLE